MSAPLLTFLISGGVTVTLVGMLRYEQAHGVRFLGAVRVVFDNLLEAIKIAAVPTGVEAF